MHPIRVTYFSYLCSLHSTFCHNRVIHNQNIQYICKKWYFEFIRVRYSLQKCSEPIKWRVMFCVPEFTKAKKTCHRGGLVRISVWLIWLIYWCGQLCNKDCIVKSSKTLIIWSAFCYTARPIGRNKRGARTTAKKRCCLWYAVDMWKSC